MWSDHTYPHTYIQTGQRAQRPERAAEAEAGVYMMTNTGRYGYKLLLLLLLWFLQSNTSVEDRVIVIHNLLHLLAKQKFNCVGVCVALASSYF